MVFLNVLHVLIAIAVVALVLVQRGAGATAGAAFGSGASGTVFGARGAGTFLTKSTWVLGAAFCAISLTMAVIVSRTDTTPKQDLGVVGTVPASTEAPAPVDTPAPEASTAADESSDLPALQVSEGDDGGGTEAQEPGADDLPAPVGENPESAAGSQDAAASAPDTGDANADGADKGSDDS